MEKKIALLVGCMLALIGFVLMIYAISSNAALEDRVGWYRDMFPSSTRYNQESNSYGILGFILLIGGIVIAAYYGGNKKIKIVSYF